MSRISVPSWLVILGCIVLYPVLIAVHIMKASSSAYRKLKSKKLRVRRRALTLPLPDSLSPWYPNRRRQKTFDQSQSLLFRLPMELRRKIYHQVIMPSDGADPYVAITDNRTSPRWPWQTKYWEPFDWSGDSIQYFDLSCPRSKGVLGLLRSCRKMSATSSLFYATTSSTL